MNLVPWLRLALRLALHQEEITPLLAMLDRYEDADTFRQVHLQSTSVLEHLRKGLEARKSEHFLSHADGRALSEVLTTVQPENDEEAKVRKDYHTAYARIANYL